MVATPACELELRPPAGRAPAAAAACGLVLLLLLIVDLPAVVRLPLLVAFVALAAGVASACARDRSRRRLRWAADGTWTVDGRLASLAGGTRVYAGLVVLHWAERHPRTCRIARGDVPDAEFRRLKVRLRFAGGPPERTADPAPAEVPGGRPC